MYEKIEGRFQTSHQKVGHANNNNNNANNVNVDISYMMMKNNNE